MDVDVESLEITLQRPGGEPRRITPELDSLRWTSAAVGGFGSFSCRFPGWYATRELPYLSLVRVTLGPRVLWEGSVETLEWSASEGELNTTVHCFGLRRLLSDTSVRDVWLWRDIEWSDIMPPQFRSRWALQSGSYDIDNLDRKGVKIHGINQFSVTSGTQAFVVWWLKGLTITRLLGTYVHAGGANQKGIIVWYENGATQFVDLGTTDADFDQATPSDVFVGFGLDIESPGLTPTESDSAEWYDIRALGRIGREDEPGAIFGGSILRDLLARVGLTPGIIDAGDDFAIESIGRPERSSALSAVEEVASYYNREWGVWEDGRFDWTDRNLDEPQWLCTLADLSSMTMTGSVDGIGRTTYLLFDNAGPDYLPDVVSHAPEEARNPYVRTGQPKDDLVQVGFPMTTTSAEQLARKIALDRNTRPFVVGRVSLPAEAVLTHAQLGPMPAWTIRAGENIRIADLPTDEIFTQGRDGETLFHIVTADVNLGEATVTLELEGQTRRTDVLLARLAAATRVVTG